MEHLEDSKEENQEEIEFGLAEFLGAEVEYSNQLLTLYIPDKDRFNKEIGTQRKWVLEAANLLAKIGGGVTIMPPVEGGWFDQENDVIIWEKPVLIYTYIKPQLFLKHLKTLRQFLHRLGSQTNQGEIALEFDGKFYRITKYNLEEKDEISN
jgi:hypothetical protein